MASIIPMTILVSKQKIYTVYFRADEKLFNE